MDVSKASLLFALFPAAREVKEAVDSSDALRSMSMGGAGGGEPPLPPFVSAMTSLRDRDELRLRGVIVESWQKKGVQEVLNRLLSYHKEC